MAYSYEMLDGAKAEIEAIVTYLLEAGTGPSLAQSFVKELESQISRICSNPAIYSLSRMPELATLGYRAALVNSYVMLYFFRDEIVFVAHVFHQRQDYAILVTGPQAQ